MPLGLYGMARLLSPDPGERAETTGRYVGLWMALSKLQTLAASPNGDEACEVAREFLQLYVWDQCVPYVELMLLLTAAGRVTQFIDKYLRDVHGGIYHEKPMEDIPIVL